MFILILLPVFSCQKEVIIEVPEEKSDEISEKITDKEVTEITPSPISIYIEENIPPYLEKALKKVVNDQPNNFSLVDEFDKAMLKIGTKEKTLIKEDKNDIKSYIKIYTQILVPVVPFYTYTDNINWTDIELYWNGKVEALDYITNDKNIPTLLISDDTLTPLRNLFDYPPQKDVPINIPIINFSNEEFLGSYWNKENIWSIVPFENLDKRWKVLKLDNKDIFDKKLDISFYPLVINYWVSGDEEGIKKLIIALSNYLDKNRDIDDLTIINMTGATAMVRGVANRMGRNGILYPAEKIGEILKSADLTHISNEIPFVENCQGRTSKELIEKLIFCSEPEYIELLKYVGADIIELTGNHMNDYGYKAMQYSLSLYEKEKMFYYAGGKNKEKAQTPLLIESNGNKFAFIGCNYWGPDYVWATDENPGAAKCDYEYMCSEIERLKMDGYIVIVTFQYVEHYDYNPTHQQIIDFRKMIDSGADIVSGSQSHHPMAAEFYRDGFINYGLGNLFFDQMFSLGVRQGIIAQHIFYKGEHISTKLITTMLEDYSQPRLTNSEERQQLLKSIFSASKRLEKISSQE
ncbi:MAG: CapA family protein [Actinomycetota bacterium]